MIHGGNSNRVVAGVSVLLALAGCGKDSDTNQLTETYLEVTDQIKHTSLEKAADGKSYRPTTAEKLVDQESNTDFVISGEKTFDPVKLKKSWGELHAREMPAMSMLIKQALSIHVKSKERLVAAALSSTNYLLTNSEPALVLVTPAQAASLKNPKQIWNVADGLAGLVYVEDLDKDYKERKLDYQGVLKNEREAFDLWLTLSAEQVRAILKDISKIVGTEIKIAIPAQPYADIVQLHGFLQGLDPHSHLQSAEEVKSIDNGNESFVGIGVYFEKGEKGFKVTEVIEGGGGAEAGLTYGDEVVQVGDTEIDLSQTSSLRTLVAGPEGTQVKLVVLRKGKRLELSVTRKKVEIRNVSAIREVNETNYVKVRSFDSATADDLGESLTQAAHADLPVILDLRNNPGGWVHVALKMVEMFEGKQATPIFYQLTRGGFETPNYAHEAADFNQDLVILLNEGSASASELSASNLKHLNRALIVGSPTYGKGTGQQISTIVGDKKNPKLGMAVTAFYYFTALNYSPQFQGIEAHVKVSEPARAGDRFSSERDLPGALLPTQGQGSFEYRPSQKISNAVSCLTAQQAALDARYREIVENNMEKPDLGLLTAVAGAKCLSAKVKAPL